LKKILFVESYPHVMFGQQRILLTLLDSCQSVGIEPIVAATAEGPLVEEVRRRSIETVFFPYPELLRSYGGAIYRYKGPRFLRMAWQLLKYIAEIRSKLKSLELDGIYCNDMRALLTVGIAAKFCGLPVLIWDKLDKPHGWMDWFQLPLVQKNLIISKAVMKKYPAWQTALLGRRILLVYEGADLAKFEGAKSIRGNLNCQEGDIVMAIVGTITERKGLDRIFSIWPELTGQFPKLRLWVAGSTTGSENDSSYLAALPNRDHPGIQFLGMREDIPDLMNSIDILLVPSRHEGFGMVIVEAMAASRPVIGAEVGGIPEVIADGETGLVVKGDDSRAWAGAIRKLYGSPELRSRMGQSGRKRVEQMFNKEKQITTVLRHCVEMTHGG